MCLETKRKQQKKYYEKMKRKMKKGRTKLRERSNIVFYGVHENVDVLYCNEKVKEKGQILKIMLRILISLMKYF